MAAQHRRMGLGGLVEGDVFDLDPRLLGELHDDDLVGALRCRPRELHLAGVLLRVLDHILDRLERAFPPDIEDALILLHVGQRGERPVVLPPHDGVDQLFGAEVVDRVPVGRLREDVVGGLDARCAGHVRHVDVHTDVLAGRVEKTADKDVAAAAGAVLDDGFDGPRRIILRLGRIRRPAGSGENQNQHHRQ